MSINITLGFSIEIMFNYQSQVIGPQRLWIHNSVSRPPTPPIISFDQLIIFHQPRFPWNTKVSLIKPSFRVTNQPAVNRSLWIWPDFRLVSKVTLAAKAAWRHQSCRNAAPAADLRDQKVDVSKLRLRSIFWGVFSIDFLESRNLCGDFLQIRRNGIIFPKYEWTFKQFLNPPPRDHLEIRFRTNQNEQHLQGRKPAPKCCWSTVSNSETTATPNLHTLQGRIEDIL